MDAGNADSEDSRRLVERVRAGDRAALDPLFARHVPGLRRMVGLRLNRRVRRRVSPSDVIQATQLDALEHLDTFLAGEPIPFRWWLQRVARERLRRVHDEHLEAGKRAVAREVPLPDRSSLQLAARVSGASTPSVQAARRELARRVRRAIAQLPETDREILLMRFFENVPYRQIGYVLKIQPAAARMRLGRALVRLGKVLREGGLTEGQI